LELARVEKLSFWGTYGLPMKRFLRYKLWTLSVSLYFCFVNTTGSGRY
jgi:hypothetical protein